LIAVALRSKDTLVLDNVADGKRIPTLIKAMLSYRQKLVFSTQPTS
jgi:hypothetical protein